MSRTQTQEIQKLRVELEDAQKELADAKKVMEAARMLYVSGMGFGMPIGTREEGVRALAAYDTKWRAGT